MATFVTRTFTAANGSTWPGFSKVAGAALSNSVTSNQGWAGSTAAQRFYKVSAYPSSANYKFKAYLKWKNAGSSGRSYGLAVRLSDDGDTAYWAEVMSYEPGPTLNKPTLRWWRRRGGTDTQLGSDVDLSSTLGSSDLNTGLEFQIRVENDPSADEVVLDLLYRIGGSGSYTGLSTYTDDVAPIWSGGTAGLVIGSNCVNDDIIVDDCEGVDFQDEAPTGEQSWEDGLGLVVNGTYYSAAQLESMGIVDIEARQGYTTASSLRIRDNRDFHDPVFLGGEDIIVTYNTTAYAWGIVRDRTATGIPPEGNEYLLRSPKDLARGVPIQDPTTNSGTVYFNIDPDNEYYQEELAGMSIGSILEWLFDNHLEGQDGLRAHLAAAPDGAAYSIPAALYTYGSELGGITVSGDFTQAVEQVLFYARSYGWYIDPGTRVHSFHKRSDSATVDVDAQAEHISAVMKKVPSKNKTAVIIHGGKPEVEYETWKLSDGTLEPGWDQSLGALSSDDWHEALENKNLDSSSVASIGVEFYQGQNRVYINPNTGQTADFVMVAGEWRGTTVNFRNSPASGYAHKVLDNSTTRIWFTHDSWPVDPPNNGDDFFLAGGPDLTMSNDATEHGNAFSEMFRLWQSPTPGKELATGECIEAVHKMPLTGGGSSINKMAGKVTGQGKIFFNTSAKLPIGLINRFPASMAQLSACFAMAPPPVVDTTTLGINDIEVTVPVLSQSVPLLRVPSSGFRGSAYSHDNAKWNGGGEYSPGYDDGVTDVLTIHDPSYQYPSVQDADYIAFADEVLASLGTLCVEAQVTIQDVLDDRFEGLDKKLTLSDVGKRVTGYESTPDLWVMEVRWNFATHTTTILCGTQGSYQGLDLEALRKVYVDNARIKNFREQLKAYEKLKNCLKESMNFAAEAIQPKGTTNNCTSNVSHSGTRFNLPGGRIGGPGGGGGGGGGPSLEELLGMLDDFLDFLADLLSDQKGVDMDFGAGTFDWGDGVLVPGITFTNPNGDTFWLGSDGTWYEDQSGNGNPDTALSGMPTGWPLNQNLNGLWGFGRGVEGIGHGIMTGMASFDGVTFFTDGIDLTGGIAYPGHTFGGGEGGFYNPPVIGGGGGTGFGFPIGGGGEVPPNAGTQGRAMKSVIGLDPVDLGGISGPIYQSSVSGASNGLYYQPRENVGGDPEGGASFVQMTNVGMGNGINGGAWDQAGSPVPFPSVDDRVGDHAHSEYQAIAEKGTADGYASLDGDSVLVEAADHIHSDVLAQRPITGDHLGQLFFASDVYAGEGRLYLWLD